jgi:hypothetical protein
VSRDPGAFRREGERLSEDFAWFSLFSFLANTQSDWQLRTSHFSGPTMGHIDRAERVSSPNERTTLKVEILQNLLASSGNTFASSPIGGGPEMWWPPKTKLAWSTSELTLTNPFCQIAVTIEPAAAVNYTVPGDDGGLNQALLPSGQPRYATRLLKFTVTATYFKLRAQNPDMPRYRTWTENFAGDLRDWFRYEEGK